MARAFKRAAYQFATADKTSTATAVSLSSAASTSGIVQNTPIIKPPPLPYENAPHQEIIVTLAHRGNHYRSMADYRILARALNEALQVKEKGQRVHNVTFNVLNTSTLVNKVAAEQIQEFHKWQVVIATHGAFEGKQFKPWS